MSKLGKHKQGKGGCIYINKLDDIEPKILETLILKSYRYKESTSY